MNRNIIRRTGIAMLALSLFLALLYGCNSSPDRKSFVLRAGLPVSELISAYGKPHKVSEGNPYHFYSWRLNEARLDNSGSRNAPHATVNSSGAVTYSSTSTPRVITVHCELSVRVNHEHRVHDWQAKDKGCRQILHQQPW